MPRRELLHHTSATLLDTCAWRQVAPGCDRSVTRAPCAYPTRARVRSRVTTTLILKLRSRRDHGIGFWEFECGGSLERYADKVFFFITKQKRLMGVSGPMRWVIWVPSRGFELRSFCLVLPQSMINFGYAYGEVKGFLEFKSIKSRQLEKKRFFSNFFSCHDFADRSLSPENRWFLQSTSDFARFPNTAPSIDFLDGWSRCKKFNLSKKLAWTLSNLLLTDITEWKWFMGLGRHQKRLLNLEAEKIVEISSDLRYHLNRLKYQSDTRVGTVVT